ncbi:hypothetical protein AVEN_246865-1 [Araneus ventricosus]|uniref:Uncharacterized protein n=1 Tax=Araneus ventricosus TaxID=182803 RepID=A0A4Y2KY14_ARAVE|nr:hypothetical protein AVEN_246865-1 [Araneus ventricosus]
MHQSEVALTGSSLQKPPQGTKNPPRELPPRGGSQLYTPNNRPQGKNKNPKKREQNKNWGPSSETSLVQYNIPQTGPSYSQTTKQTSKNPNKKPHPNKQNSQQNKQHNNQAETSSKQPSKIKGGPKSRQNTSATMFAPSGMRSLKASKQS